VTYPCNKLEIVRLSLHVEDVLHSGRHIEASCSIPIASVLNRTSKRWLIHKGPESTYSILVLQGADS
jgi:hypothetical protein